MNNLPYFQLKTKDSMLAVNIPLLVFRFGLLKPTNSLNNKILLYQIYYDQIKVQIDYFKVVLFSNKVQGGIVY